MIIPYHQLAPETLSAVVMELITREGTDYGEHAVPIAQQEQQLYAALKAKQCFIHFDSATETLGLVSAQEAKTLGLL